jgi:hypothetical protein
MLFRYRGLDFGAETSTLISTGTTPPTMSLRTDYTERLQRDGVTVGRDYLGSASWAITLATNAGDLAGALGAAADLEERWKAEAVRSSTAPAALDYSTDLGDTWHRVYGRPGLFTGFSPNARAMQGSGQITLEWVQTDPSHYSAAEHQATIVAQASVVGGIVAPLVAPITTVATGGERAGVLQNDGDRPSPARVRFYGPSTDPIIRTDRGTIIAYKGTLAYDQWVELNAWDATVKLNNGASVAGRLDRRTVVSKMAVPAGRSEWAYAATDLSGTSRAVIYWRDAHTSLQ